MEYLRAIGLIIFSGVLAAGAPIPFAKAQSSIDEGEFRELVRDLAPKVTLFAEIWKMDPRAILYGGTSRDFVYWVLGQMKEGRTADELRRLDYIDIRKIVGKESDVDVVSSRPFFFDASDYGVKKIDRIDPARIDPQTDEGRSELNQGYIPLEKIELAQDGLRAPSVFGDGVKEILSGNISFHSTDGSVFWNTHFAKQNLNHPVFLATRYIRIRAMHWYRMHGSGLPDRTQLLDYDPGIKAQIRRLIENARLDSKFREVLRNEKALKWFNGSVLKGFRSYTNLTATYLLFVDAGFLELQQAFPTIATINQFLYLQYRDVESIQENFKSYHTSPENLFVPTNQAIAGLKLLHGTRQEESFRAILFQNALPSSDGLAGAGLYAADLAHKNIALTRGGSEDRIVEFTVSEDAKLIDITQGHGKEIFERWKQNHPHENHDAFAKAFGADILKYPYAPYPHAFVVKNSAVLVGREGLTRKLVTVSEAFATAERTGTSEDFERLIALLHLNSFSRPEVEIIFRAIPSATRDLWISQIAQSNRLSASQIRWFIPYSPKKVLANLFDHYGQKLEGQVSSSLMYGYYRDLFRSFPQTERDLLVDTVLRHKRAMIFSAFIDDLITPPMGLGQGELFLSEEAHQKAMDAVLSDAQLHEVVLKTLKPLFTAPREFAIPHRAYNNWIYDHAPAWISKMIQGGMAPGKLFADDFLLLNPPRDSGLTPWRSRPEFNEWMLGIANSDNVPIDKFLETITHQKYAHLDGSDLPGKERLTEWISHLLRRSDSMSKLYRDKLTSPSLLERFILARDIHSPECARFIDQRMLQSEDPTTQASNKHPPDCAGTLAGVVAPKSNMRTAP